MMAVEVADASITLPLQSRKVNVAGLVADPGITAALRSSLSALVSAFEEDEKGL